MLKLASLFLAFILAASAQSGQKAPTEGPQVAYSQVPFAISATQLPPHFAGHDIVMLYNAFDKLSQIKRDEYETTETFNQRTAALRLKPVVGSITTQAVLAFAVPVSTTAPPWYADGFSSRYDADKRLVDFEVQCSKYRPSYGAIPSPKLRRSIGYSVAINTDTTSHDGIGSTAFGATVATTHIHEEQYEVVWDNAREYKNKAAVGETVYKMNSSVQADPEAARRIRETLSALVVCSLKDDVPTFYDTEGYSATLDHPTSRLTWRHFLNTTLLAVWFFDSASGKVYARIDSASGKVYARIEPKPERKK